MHILETRNLNKTYGSGDAEVHALSDISTQVNAGELVAIIGPSGSGKSTLLTILGGVETPTSGEVLLEGKDYASLSEDERTLLRRRRIGFIFQSFNLLPNLSAYENIALPMQLDGRSRDEIKQNCEYALKLVEMEHRSSHLPSALSGGEQQRIAIARALAIKPALLLADEPTGNLDSRQSKRISTLLQDLVKKEGHTIVMVTHDPGIAMTASRIIMIRDGQVEQDGAPSELVKTNELLMTSND